jgi:hypothetical protein
MHKLRASTSKLKLLNTLLLLWTIVKYAAGAKWETCLNQIFFFYQSLNSSTFGYELRQYLQIINEEFSKIKN